MRGKRSIISFAFLIILVAFGFASASEDRDLESRLDEYLQPYLEDGLFSGSILVAKGGEVILAKGYGMANLEHGVPNGPETKFRLGSLTKQFTAMAILQLEERGLLSVGDPLSKFIPDYPNGEKITIHHLLTHTSGVPNFTGFPDYEETMMIPSPLEMTIERFKNKPLDFELGEQFSYSNSGYILLSYILEKVSGKSYEDYVLENIFEPLGMRDTGYDHFETVIENRAGGYSFDGEIKVNASFIDMSIPSGAGSLYSTVMDLAVWDRSLYTEKLLSKAGLEKMVTPLKGNYAYGWAVSERFGKKLISHRGGINGFVTSIQRFVDDDVLVVVLCNLDSSPIGKVSKDLSAMVFGEEYEQLAVREAVEIAPAVLEDYTGRYQMTPNLVITVTSEGGRLFIQVTGQPRFELFPESETKFFLKVVEAQISFVRGEDGKVTHLILHQGGLNQPAKRIEE